jgi:glucose-1-phosphate thymidylyltransferase
MKQAVIMAAGEGQRLRPFTVNRPKVMLPIAGKPILQYVVEALVGNGIRNIVLVVGYRREQIYDYMGGGEEFGADITYVAQEQQLGTAHSLVQAKDAVEDEFLVLPGDNLIDAGTIRQFVTARPSAVLVKETNDPARYGVVVAEGGMVKEIVEKPVEATGNIVNTGIYVFPRQIFDYFDSELNIPDVLNGMLAQNCPIRALETTGTWLDIVYPWDILGLNGAILRRIEPNLGGTIESGATVTGTLSVGKGTVIRSNSYVMGPVVIGENCDIGPNACIFPATSLGDNVAISPFTEIRNSVVGDDVSIGAGSIVQDSVIDDGCVIEGHFIANSGRAEVNINEEHHNVDIGAMIGLNCNLGSGVVARPGVIVGNHSRIEAMKLISGRLPDRSLVL